MIGIHQMPGAINECSAHQRRTQPVLWSGAWRTVVNRTSEMSSPIKWNYRTSWSYILISRILLISVYRISDYPNQKTQQTWGKEDISNRTMFIVFAFSAYSVQFIIELISSCNSQRMIYQLEIYFKVSINTRHLTRKSYSPVNHEHATPSGLFLFY